MPTTRVDYDPQDIERWKSEINLVEYALSRGYEIHRRETSGRYVVMTSGSDKIMITRKGSHWVFCDNRDGTRGTIIDLVAKLDGLYLARGRVNFGAVFRVLRTWTGDSPNRPVWHSTESLQVPLSLAASRASIARQFEAASQPVTNAYLNSRGISTVTLQEARFRGRWRVSERGNVLFPHYDSRGISGYEVKNRGFTSFSPGGWKSAWHSNIVPTDDKLVMTESAIDALSYHQLNPDGNARYLSTGGALSTYQRGTIVAAIADLRAGAAVTLAFDNDAGGERLARVVDQLVGGRVPIFRHVPPHGAKDWNDHLRGVRRPFRADNERSL